MEKSKSAPLDHLKRAESAGARLWMFAALDRDDLWLLVIYASAIGLLNLAAPIAVQSLVSSVAFGVLLQPIVVLSLLLMLALGIQAALKAMSLRVVELLEERCFVRAAVDFSWRLGRITDESDEHDLDAKFFEVVSIQKSIRTLLSDGLGTVLQIAIGLLVLAFYHPALLAFDLILLVLIALIIWIPASKGLATSLSESKKKYALAGYLRKLHGARTQSERLNEADIPPKTESLVREYLDARRSHFRVAFGQQVGALVLQVLAITVVLGLGGYLVLMQQLTLGQLVAAELIVASIAAGVAKLGKHFDAGYDLLTSLEKLGHVIELETQDSLVFALSKPLTTGTDEGHR
jgi:putative ABC transport system ATP-binding protein